MLSERDRALAMRTIHAPLEGDAPVTMDVRSLAKLIAGAREEGVQDARNRDSPCCQHMAERLRQRAESNKALSVLRSRGHKLSPAEAARADLAEGLVVSQTCNPDGDHV